MYQIPVNEMQAFLKQYEVGSSEFDKLSQPTIDPSNKNGYDWLDKVENNGSVCYHPGRDYNRGSGMDDLGDPIFAVADGYVSSIYPMDGTWGNHMFTKHEINHKVHGKIKFWTHYAHIEKFKCEVGQKILSGEKIATVGNTGASSAAHLHMELQKDNGNDWGASFYPWGKSKSWVIDNYYSPDEFII